MSNLKHAQREALAQAIENKVHRLDLASLVKLAAELKVPVPSGIKAARGSIRRAEPRSAQRSQQVLAGGGLGPVIAVAEGNEILDAITEDHESADWADSELLGAGEAVTRLGIARATLDNWRKAGRIIALRKGLRNFLYPVRQFEGMRPVEGLKEVADHFASPEAAWEWLVVPNQLTDRKAPLEILRRGEVSSVIRAAEGALDYA